MFNAFLFELIVRLLYNQSMKYQKIDQTLKAIQKFKFQGATAVATATLTVYRDYGLALKLQRPDNWRTEMKAVLKYLIKHNRPTEPLAHNGLYFVWHRIKECPSAVTLRAAVDEYLEMIVTTQHSIAMLGRSVVKRHDHVLTHCHSSTVEYLLIEAHRSRNCRIISTETRPKLQGRITAKELLKHHILVTEIVDSAAPFYLSRESRQPWRINRVIIGADLVMPSGAVINKIGSYGICLAAHTNGVPVYVATSLLKYSAVKNPPIEQRPESEIWPRDPKGLQIINPAFDIVPEKLIAGIVCEFGIIKPSAIKATVQRYYPWLLKQ
jgi:ribose 1,5-bisphosphate isomerase